MRRALASLVTFIATCLGGPIIAEALFLALGPAAGLLGYALSRQLAGVAQKLQSDDPPRKTRCPPGTTSSTR